MPTRILQCLSVAALLSFVANAESAEVADGPEAEGPVQFGASLRYRAELVDDEGVDDAVASTLRTSLTVGTRPFYGLSFVGEVEDVTVIGNDLYNDGGSNGVTGRAVIADPDGTEINQAMLQYTGLSDTRISAGRQTITQRDAPFHRFVGNVGWRQNQQSYDGVRIENTSIRDVSLDGGYIHNVNRIFGEDNPLPNRSDFELDGWLLRAVYSGLDGIALETYVQHLDFDDALALSTRTVGLRGSGSVPMGSHKLLYALEYAVQEDIADNPASYDVDYALADLGIVLPGELGLTFKLSYELLEGTGNPGESFQTPLATLHAFQGWADKFLTTPDSGVEDLYATIKGKLGRFQWLAAYHDFSADSGSFDYGSELDLELTTTIAKRVSIGLKYADYNASGNDGNAGVTASDTRKVWAWAQVAL